MPASWARVRLGSLLSCRAISTSGEISAALSKLLARSRTRNEDDARLLPGDAPRSSTSTAIEQLGAAGLADETKRHAAHRHRKAVRHGSAFGPSFEPNAASHVSTSGRSIASIIIWAKKRCRTCWCLRFANTIFEPIWNRNYIDHVQITVAEEVTVGRRGALLRFGGRAARHVSEPFAAAADDHGDGRPGAIRGRIRCATKKSKCCGPSARYAGADFAQSTRPRAIRRLPQRTGRCRRQPDRDVRGSEAAHRQLALEGVPFYLRSGKAMSCRTTQIVIQFREPPHMLFNDGPRDVIDANRLGDSNSAGRRHSTAFSNQSARRGHAAAVDRSRLQLSTKNSRATLPEAYERLLLDALNGDASLFAQR